MDQSMILRYFLGAELFVVLGYLLGNAVFPKRYSLIFYKFLGVIVYSLLLWYAAQFSGESWISLIPVTLGSVVFLGLGLSMYKKQKIELPSKSAVRELVAIELISAVVFFVLVYLRSFKPDIFGTEKLMDVGIINALLKQGTIPLENFWMSGFYMNYYYFGHFILALLQKLFIVPSAVGYNLAISLLAVWIIQAAYLVGRSFRFTKLQAIGTSILMLFGGNLYLLVQSIFYPGGNQWFASATRVIPYTINEFPAYSVFLGDLHGHYLSYPFFLVAIFLIVDIFLPSIKSKNDSENLLFKSSFLGMLIGGLYIINSWDVLSLALFGGALGVGMLLYINRKNPNMTNEWLKLHAIQVGIPLIIFAVPQYFASKQYFIPPVGGVGVNTVYSSFGDLLMLFGQFAIIALCGGFMVYYSYTKLKTIKTLKRIQIILPVLFLVMGISLIGLVEVFHLKDVFSKLNPDYSRTNTVFKIYFHVWVFLIFGSMGLFFEGAKGVVNKFSKVPWMGLVHTIPIFIIANMFAYSYIAVKQYIVPQFIHADMSRVYDATWSDGYAYTKDMHDVDYNLISYLGTLPKSNILEIVVYDSYSYYARISAYTGHSAVTGWPLHNVQWYNGYDGEGIVYGTSKKQLIKIADRVNDVAEMYSSTDIPRIEKLLKKYSIEHVIFGDQEYDYYETKGILSNEDIYISICKIEWSEGSSTIYDCRR